MDNCNIHNPYTPFAINISIHVIILLIILSVLFIFVITKIEKNELNNQITDNINKLVTPIQNDDLKNSVVLKKLKDKYAKEDAKVKLSNSWLTTSIITTDLFLAVMATAIIITLMFQCNQCLPIGEILAMNAVTFIGVGIIEYLFFMNVALKYIPIKPSMMVSTFIESVGNHI